MSEHYEVVVVGTDELVRTGALVLRPRAVSARGNVVRFEDLAGRIVALAGVHGVADE